MSEFLEPAIEELWNKNKGILEDYIRNVLLNFNELTFKDFLSGILYKMGVIDFFGYNITYIIGFEFLLIIVYKDCYHKFTSRIYFDGGFYHETPLSRIQDPTKIGEKPDGWQVFDTMVLAHEILANMIDCENFNKKYCKVTPD